MTNSFTYEAIITISLPGTAAPLEARVHLLPTDQIATAQGQTKLLADCTLDDLSQFADQLEQEMWQPYGTHKLRDLKQENPEAAIKITLITDEALDKPWLAQAAVLLPHTAVVPPTPAPDWVVDEVVIEPPPAGEALPEVEEIPLVAAEPTAEPEIIVSETEPVHEELEAAEQPAIKVQLERSARVAGDRAALHAPVPHACDIFMDEEPFRAMQAHALSSMSREVAGVLVGPHPEKQPDGRYIVHVTDSIIAKHTRMQGASVTYTPESWRYVNDVMMERYPQEEAVIIGWYHTHPGFGIFLSNMDLFIHHNFFTQKWHLALVLDPVGQRSGFFTWDRQQKEVLAYPFPWPYWAHRSW